MPIPAGLEGVTVTVGPLYGAALEPISGLSIGVTLSAKVRITASGVLLASHYSLSTDANGEATFELVASDSTGLDISGFTYNIRVPGVTPDGGANVLLPAAVPTVRLEDLSPITQSGGVIIWVPSEITDAQIDAIVSDGGSTTRSTLNALYGGGGGGGIAGLEGFVGNLVHLTDAAAARTHPQTAAAITEGVIWTTDVKPTNYVDAKDVWGQIVSAVVPGSVGYGATASATNHVFTLPAQIVDYDAIFVAVATGTEANTVTIDEFTERGTLSISGCRVTLLEKEGVVADASASTTIVSSSADWIAAIAFVVRRTPMSHHLQWDTASAASGTSLVAPTVALDITGAIFEFAAVASPPSTDPATPTPPGTHTEVVSAATVGAGTDGVALSVAYEDLMAVIAGESVGGETWTVDSIPQQVWTMAVKVELP